MALCRISNKRAAKRFCPALSAGICAICCARDRMIQIACPESCEYLGPGREAARAREKILRAKGRSQAGRAAFRLKESQAIAGTLIHLAIIDVQRESLRDLDDSEVLAALRNARKNLETVDSGLIYEHQDTSRRVQQVSQRIREKLEEFVKNPGAEERILRADMIEALRLLEEVVETHI